MSDFARLVAELVQLLWPFRQVQEWEQACYYVCGKRWKVVGPGLKVVVPWFCTVREIGVVPHIAASGRQDITLRDGATLSFDATATCQVFDADLALNAIDDCHHSASTLLGAVLAERLAEVDASRLAPEKRKRLFTELAKKVNDETKQFGMETRDIRFTSFVLNVRTYRLLNDASLGLN